MTAHLKSGQVNDVLLGIAGSEAAAHLTSCAQCRAAVETMRQTFVSFQIASVRWSDDAARQIAPGKRQPRPLWARPAWAFVAAVIALAIAIPFSIWRGRANEKDMVAAADSQAQISRDNQLLADIQSAIGETTPAPLQPLQVSK
jgi:hypothetical protein